MRTVGPHAIFQVQGEAIINYPTEAIVVELTKNVFLRKPDIEKIAEEGGQLISTIFLLVVATIKLVTMLTFIS